MKLLITLAIVALLFYGGRAILRRYEQVERDSMKPGTEQSSRDAKTSAPSGTPLEGLPPNLEPALEAAEKQGATGLRNFLTTHSGSIRDPRLADIELDYVVFLSRQDPAEAKRVFQAIQSRVPATSPVYPRIKKLESTFQ